MALLEPKMTVIYRGCAAKVAKLLCKWASKGPETTVKLAYMFKNYCKILGFQVKKRPESGKGPVLDPKVAPKMAKNYVFYWDFCVNMSKTVGFCEKRPLDVRSGHLGVKIVPKWACGRPENTVNCRGCTQKRSNYCANRPPQAPKAL